MKCPRCKRDVDVLWGNGVYPNTSFRCEQCDSNERKLVVMVYLVVVGLAVAALVIWF